MKIVLSKPTSGYNLAAINDNFAKIEQEFQNKVLYRDNPVGEPNTLQTDIDGNSRDIYNVRDIYVLRSFSVNGVDLSTILAQASEDAASAAASALEAEGFADDAEISANSAFISATDAADSYALTDSIADSLAGGTIGFDAIAYDFGSVADETTYFNRDFGSIV